MNLSSGRGWWVIPIITPTCDNSTISVCMYLASTLVNRTRTTLQSVVIVPAHKISILSPVEGPSASAVAIRNSSSSQPVRDIWSKGMFTMIIRTIYEKKRWWPPSSWWIIRWTSENSVLICYISPIWTLVRECCSFCVPSIAHRRFIKCECYPIHFMKWSRTTICNSNAFQFHTLMTKFEEL